MLCRISLWFLVLAVAATSNASVQDPSRRLYQTASNGRDRQVWKILRRAADFSDIPHVNARPAKTIGNRRL
jgi:hypothetical protein